MPETAQKQTGGWKSHMDFPDFEIFSQNGFSKNIFGFYKSKWETLIGNLIEPMGSSAKVIKFFALFQSIAARREIRFCIFPRHTQIELFKLFDKSNLFDLIWAIKSSVIGLIWIDLGVRNVIETTTKMVQIIWLIWFEWQNCDSNNSLYRQHLAVLVILRP